MKHPYMWVLWLGLFFVPMLIPEIHSGVFYVNQCLVSFCLGYGLLKIHFCKVKCSSFMPVVLIDVFAAIYLMYDQTIIKALALLGCWCALNFIWKYRKWLDNNISAYAPEGVIFCLTTLFAIYNLLALSEYLALKYSLSDSYYLNENYVLVQDAINLIEFLTLITCTLVWLYGYTSSNTRYFVFNPGNYLHRPANTMGANCTKGSKIKV